MKRYTPSVESLGRHALTLEEISGRMACSRQDLLEAIDTGEISALNIAAKETRRGVYRVPVESYAIFVAIKTSGPVRLELIRLLPRFALQELSREIASILGPADAVHA